MFQAIVTKFFGPTNHHGSRVKATCQVGSVTIAWDHALDSEANHKAAARELARKLGWSGTWYGGGNPDGKGNTYVRYDGHYGSFGLSVAECVNR